MKQFAGTAVALLALAGCAPSPGPIASNYVRDNRTVEQRMMDEAKVEATKPHTLTAAQRKEVEIGVRRSLKDPDSARFGRFVATTDDKGKVHVCGYVNAKNSYGGYTGEKLFHGVFPTDNKGAFAAVGIGGGDNESIVTSVMCKTYGMTDI